MEKVIRKVKIGEHELYVVFNMAVELMYEEISGKAFNLEMMDTQTATMHLCYASLSVANKDVPFSYDWLKENVTMTEFVSLKNAVIDALTEWFTVPEVLKKTENDEGDNAKN